MTYPCFDVPVQQRASDSLPPHSLPLVPYPDGPAAIFRKIIMGPVSNPDNPAIQLVQTQEVNVTCGSCGSTGRSVVPPQLQPENGG